MKDNISIIGFGVHPFGDSKIVDEFYEEEYTIDVREWNTYALKWDEEKIEYFLNGVLIKVIHQSPNYEMQIMLNLYDLENINNEKNIFEIDYVKVYQ